MDTVYSSGLTFSNWTVYNGDDSISFKANSTDMTIINSQFHTGLGVAIGSIGQYLGVFDTIERINVTQVAFYGTLHAVRSKKNSPENEDCNADMR